MFGIIKKELLVLVRDRSNLFLMILFPLILVFLLGNLLENTDVSDATIEPMKVAYTIEMKDSHERAATEGFLDEVKDNKTLIMKETDDIEGSKAELGKGNLAGVVVFKGHSVEIYEGLDRVQNRALNIVFRSFTVHAEAITALEKNAPYKMGQLAEAMEGDGVRGDTTDFTRNMLDYYAVAMVVMIIFMSGAIGGAAIIFDNRRNGTLSRSLVSAKSRQSVYIQTVLTSLPQTFVQVLVIMVPTVLIFGARYADNLADNVILFAMFVIFGIALSASFTLVGIFVKNNPTMVIMPILWVLMFISGTFSKEIYIDGITSKMPPWLVQNAAFELTVFGEPEKCFAVMAVCLCIAAAATLAGTILFGRKGLIS